MWHYTEGMFNWDPVCPTTVSASSPARSSMWFDAAGDRLPTNLFPVPTTSAPCPTSDTGHGYSWSCWTRPSPTRSTSSGSEQNSDLTDKSFKKLAGKVGPGTHVAVQNFMDHGGTGSSPMTWTPWWRR